MGGLISGIWVLVLVLRGADAGVAGADYAKD